MIAGGGTASAAFGSKRPSTLIERNSPDGPPWLPVFDSTHPGDSKPMPLYRSNDCSRLPRWVSTAVSPAVALVLLVPLADLRAAGPEPFRPSADRGRVLAQNLCAGCHVVAGAEGAAATAGIPTLRAIATRPEQTGRRIENALIAPHAPMPDMLLSMMEIKDIIAYLDTLRADGSLPPLQEPAAPDRPKYPSPS